MGTQLPSPLPQQGRGQSPPIFGPCLLSPNGCMDQDETWHGSRPWPWPHVLDGTQLPSSKGAQPRRFQPISVVAKWLDSSKRGDRAPQFSAHVYCGQTAVWVKMKLGMVVGLSPAHTLLDGDPAPPPPKGHTPSFRPMSIVTKWLDESRWHLA